MKIFGINFTTKKELRNTIDKLSSELEPRINSFPFVLGQVVYDIALKNDKGRFTRTSPSREHSTITAVEVTEKNYFKLVERYRRNDVFMDETCAEGYLNAVCK